MKSQTILLVVALVSSISVAMYLYYDRKQNQEDFESLEERIEAEENEEPQTIYISRRPRLPFMWHRRRHRRGL